MFFYLAAVLDATHRDIFDETAQSLLFHVHVFVTTVGTFIMNLINVHTKMVYLDLEVIPDRLAGQDRSQQVVLQ